MVGGPRRALIARAEALRIIHLITVTGLNVGLNPRKTLQVLGFAGIRLKMLKQLEGVQHRRCGHGKQRAKALAFGRVQAWVKHQLAALLLVIGDQGPGVEAKTGIGQIEVVESLGRQLFKSAAEVVTQVANQSADERKRIICRCLALAETGKALA